MANNQNLIPGLITFDVTPQSRFYFCRSCGACLFTWENQIYWERPSRIIICENPVNLRPANIDVVRFFDGHPTWINVFCKQCNSALGQQISSIVGQQTQRQGANSTIQEERFIFHQNALLFWNGRQVVYPDTLEPFGAN